MRARVLGAAVVVALIGAGLGVVAPSVTPAPAAAAPTGFVTMSDGTSIAINVRMPDGYVEGQQYPTIFEMSGYDGGSADGGTLLNDFGLVPITEQIPGFPLPSDDSRQLSSLFYEDYVTIHASVRGSGCSSGQFDLFSWRSALDGKEIIDGWIAEQPWSNGDVGLLGHSYGGITGFMIAATQPEHLRGATLSGLVDDLYRGLVYPGGVSNYGFPLLWTGGLRPAYDIAGGLLPGLIRPEEADDDPNRQEQCAANVLGKSITIVDNPLIQGLNERDNEWYRSRSLMTYVNQVQVPVHITGAYQDEQTGPRGPAHLYEELTGVPKRLVLTNGNHDTESTAAYGVPEIRADRKAWMDQWLRGVDGGFGALDDDEKSVTTFLETHRDSAGTLTPNGRLDGPDYPYPDTQWTDYYLRGDGTLSPNPPTTNERKRSYVSGIGRQLWSYQAGYTVGPPLTTLNSIDEVRYRSAPLAEDVTIAGPITATLFMHTLWADTELFVQVIDEAPDGSRTFLQRGVLRASHRAIDPARSDTTPTGEIYRPYRPHESITQLPMGQLLQPRPVHELLVEVWPVGHVFRAGHRIMVKVHAPPLVDSFYIYVPRTAPGVNEILSGPTTPSRIMLPIVPFDGPLGPAITCGDQEAVRCIRPGQGGF